MKTLTMLTLVAFSLFSACTKKEEAPPEASAPAAQAPSGKTYAVSGKVLLKSAAPKAEPLKMSADPYCAKANGGKTVMSETVMAGAGGTLANVFVYVKEGAKPAPAENLPPIVFDQKGCVYHPHVLGIRAGQTLKIVNSDATLHNVNAMAKTNSPFNLGMPKKDQAVEKKFTKPEVMVRFKCDVHGWMNAYVGVLDHPYFAVTDSTGAFTFKDLPAGEYTVEAWHEKLGTKTAKLSVSDATASQSLDFSF